MRKQYTNDVTVKLNFIISHYFIIFIISLHYFISISKNGFTMIEMCGICKME